MFATATFLSLLGATPGAEGDVEALASDLYGEGAIETVGAFEGAEELAERARELGGHEGVHLEILWLGEIDAEGFTVGGVDLAEFWQEGGALASLRVRSIDAEGFTLGGFTVIPVTSPQILPRPPEQISPTDDVGFMELDFLNPVEFEDGTSLGPADYGNELYPGIMGAAWAPVVGVVEWRVSNSTYGDLGNVVAITPNAQMDGRRITAINGFSTGFEYWRWSTTVSWPSTFELKRCMVGGTSLLGGPWEVHDDQGFGGSGGPPPGVTSTGTWYEISGGAAGPYTSLGAWLGRKIIMPGTAVGPSNNGSPFLVHDQAEIHFLAEPFSLSNGRLRGDPVEPFVFTATPPPAGATHHIWSGSHPQFP